MRLVALGLIGFLTLGSLTALVAQTIDGLDLDAVRSRAAAVASDAEAFAAQVKDRGEEFRSEAATVRAGGMENLQRGAQTLLPKGAEGPANFDELVQGAASNAAVPGGEAPQFIVFASLSMPPQSLKPLIADTARAGGVVVFRGFPNNSSKAFVTALSKVVEERDLPNIGIDPRLFSAFHVEAVPAFVAVSSSFDLCSGFRCETKLPPFDRMAGNVSVNYALTTFAEGNGPGGKIAALALANMKKAAKP